MTGAKQVQYAIHRFLKEVEIQKQHVPQLIAVAPESTFRMCYVMRAFNSVKYAIGVLNTTSFR